MGSGADAESYMRKGFQLQYIRKCTNIFTIYEMVVSHPSEFSVDPLVQHLKLNISSSQTALKT